MSLRYGAAVLAAVCVTAAGHVALAHHSVAGEFDTHKRLTLSGVVSQVDWANPHIYIDVDVKDVSGATNTWRLETVPVAMMRKAGLSKTLLLGDGRAATIDAYPARDGTPYLGYLVKITYADGHHYQFDSDK